jgi:hypothetical protein
MTPLEPLTALPALCLVALFIRLAPLRLDEVQRWLTPRRGPTVTTAAPRLFLVPRPPKLPVLVAVPRGGRGLKGATAWRRGRPRRFSLRLMAEVVDAAS